MSDIVQKDSVLFLTCIDSISFRGPYRCLVKQTCQDKHGQYFYLLSVDPIWELKEIAGIREETLSEIVVCTSRIEEKKTLFEGWRRISLNVFSFLAPNPSPELFLDIKFGRIYLLVHGEAHETEADAREHLTHM